jgi:hypothetical protein
MIFPTMVRTPSACSQPTRYIDIIGKVFDRTLSKIERAGMAAVYGNPATLPSAIVTNTNDSGPGSLRSAIYYAFDRSTDAIPAPTTVIFHIPNTDLRFAGGVFTIKPTYIMTAPGAGTTIDGTTETTFNGDTNTSGPEIVLDGTEQAKYEVIGGIFGPGFILREANCTVKGFVINGYDQQGIQLKSDGASGSVATGNVISGCCIGTDKTGTVGIGNGSTWPGIEISGGANHNTIAAAPPQRAQHHLRQYRTRRRHPGRGHHQQSRRWELHRDQCQRHRRARILCRRCHLQWCAEQHHWRNDCERPQRPFGKQRSRVVITDSGTNGNVVQETILASTRPGTRRSQSFDDPTSHFYVAALTFRRRANNTIGEQRPLGQRNFR